MVFVPFVEVTLSAEQAETLHEHVRAVARMSCEGERCGQRRLDGDAAEVGKSLLHLRYPRCIASGGRSWVLASVRAGAVDSVDQDRIDFIRVARERLRLDTSTAQRRQIAEAKLRAAIRLGPEAGRSGKNLGRAHGDHVRLSTEQPLPSFSRRASAASASMQNLLCLQCFVVMSLVRRLCGCR